MSYQRVIDKIQEHNLSWQEIDRIEVDEETYEDFVERSSFDLSNYSTTNNPAVRVTTGQEKVVYVADNGMEITLEI